MIKYGIKSIDCYAEEYFSDIYNILEVTKMSACKSETVSKLEIREALPSESTKYYGWFDLKTKDISMIYPNEFLFNMCFPYGYKNEEKHNEGKQVKVFIKEIKNSHDKIHNKIHKK